MGRVANGSPSLEKRTSGQKKVAAAGYEGEMDPCQRATYLPAHGAGHCWIFPSLPPATHTLDQSCFLSLLLCTQSWHRPRWKRAEKDLGPSQEDHQGQACLCNKIRHHVPTIFRLLYRCWSNGSKASSDGCSRVTQDKSRQAGLRAKHRRRAESGLGGSLPPGCSLPLVAQRENTAVARLEEPLPT